MRERGKKISNCKSKKNLKFLTRLMITYLGIDFLRGVSNVPLTSFPTLMRLGVRISSGTKNAQQSCSVHGSEFLF